MMDVVIVNHNTHDQLQACLTTVEAEGAARVVVVDNASTDSSAAMVQRDFPRVMLHANRTNRGYGAGANQGIAACGSPYVLLLNSDTRLLPGTLAALSQYLDRHPQAAIVGPRLLNPDRSLQPSCYAFPTPWHVFLEESAAGHLVGRMPVLRDRYLRTWSHTHSRRVPWVLGAALALRRPAFASVSGFDTAYFMYAEEVDLSFRLAQDGWQTHFTPDAVVVHEGGASTSQQRAPMAAQYYASLLRFYRRHYPPRLTRTLRWILRSVALARLVRDSVGLRLTTEPSAQTRLRANLSAWQSMLLPPAGG